MAESSTVLLDLYLDYALLSMQQFGQDTLRIIRREKFFYRSPKSKNIYGKGNLSGKMFRIDDKFLK